MLFGFISGVSMLSEETFVRRIIGCGCTKGCLHQMTGAKRLVMCLFQHMGGNFFLEVLEGGLVLRVAVQPCVEV